MASRTKHLEQRLGFFLFSRFQRSFLRKDQLGAERAGAKLGMLLYRLDKKHRNRALSNLELALGDLSLERRTDIAQHCFQHFGRVFADFLRSSQRTDADIRENCPLIGFEVLDDALRQGNGALLITGHFGNWERSAHALTVRGYKVTTVARDANDSSLNQEVMRIRENQGIKVLSRGNAARGMLKTLKKNEVVAVLTDQNSGDLFVPFFGKPAGTVSGISSMSLKTGAPMIPFYCTWLAPGRYEARAHAALEADAGYDPVEGLTRAMNLSLEQAIREAPEQWLWFHNRWKSAYRAGLI